MAKREVIDLTLSDSDSDSDFTANVSVVNLIREIRDNSLFVYGSHLNMLNMIVCTVSCE